MVRAAVFRDCAQVSEFDRLASGAMAVVFISGSRRRVCGVETRPRVGRRAGVDFYRQLRRANQLQRRCRRTGEFPLSRLSGNDVVDRIRLTRLVIKSSTLERAARCAEHNKPLAKVDSFRAATGRERAC